MTDTLSQGLGIIVSSLVMLGLVVAIVRAEIISGKKARDFIAHNKEQIADLAQRTQQRYRARYGKDPTMEMPIHDADTPPQGEGLWRNRRLPRK